jgi:orotidine-5'-phosphate decarboxylase
MIAKGGLIFPSDVPDVEEAARLVAFLVIGRSIRDAADPREAAARVVGEIERALKDRQAG